MALSVFAVLIVIVTLAVAWGGAAVALRQSQQLAVDQTGAADVWVAETDAEPGWAITPVHMRMW